MEKVNELKISRQNLIQTDRMNLSNASIQHRQRVCKRLFILELMAELTGHKNAYFKVYREGMQHKDPIQIHLHAYRS